MTLEYLEPRAHEVDCPAPSERAAVSTSGRWLVVCCESCGAVRLVEARAVSA